MFGNSVNLRVCLTFVIYDFNKCLTWIVTTLVSEYSVYSISHSFLILVLYFHPLPAPTHTLKGLLEVTCKRVHNYIIIFGHCFNVTVIEVLPSIVS